MSDFTVFVHRQLGEKHESSGMQHTVKGQTYELSCARTIVELNGNQTCLTQINLGIKLYHFNMTRVTDIIYFSYCILFSYSERLKQRTNIPLSQYDFKSVISSK